MNRTKRRNVDGARTSKLYAVDRGFAKCYVSYRRNTQVFADLGRTQSAADPEQRLLLAPHHLRRPETVRTMAMFPSLVSGTRVSGG